MTNIYTLPSQERRYDEASLWIERLGEGLSAAEEREFAAWMADDPANQAVLFRMAELWDKMDTLSRLSTLFPEPPVEPLVGRPARHWPRYLAAASVLIAIASLWAGLTFERLPFGDRPAVDARGSMESVYETAIGEQATVALTDGTELALNTNSRIRAYYTPGYRLLILESGEVHVKVAEDAARPLSVIAGDRIVQAVGTAFNVEITDDRRVELMVTEGKVRVAVHAPPEAPGGAPPRRIEPALLPPSATTVTAGQELILGQLQETVTPVSPEDIEVKLSWRQGNLVFRGETLEEAVAEVGRYTAVEFVIVDENLKHRRVSGLFKAGDVEGMLAVLRENFDIAYERTDDNRVLLSAL